MRCAVDGGQGGSVHALKEELVSALHRRMTCSAPKHEGWDFDCGQCCCRQRETIRTRPVKNVDRRCLHCIGANTRRPGGERTNTTVEVDHGRDRFGVSALKGGKISIRHPPECAIVLLLSPFSQQLCCRRLNDHKASPGRTWLRSATASATKPPKEWPTRWTWPPLAL